VSPEEPVERARVKRGLNGLLIFIAGTLFGVFAFFVVTMLRPEPPPAAEAPPPVAPPAVVVAPPAAEPPAAALPPAPPPESTAPPPAPPLAPAPSAAPPSPAPAPSSSSSSSPAPAITPAAPAVEAQPAEQPKKSTLIVPVQGITAKQLSDTYYETRGTTRRHEALDIVAPRGTPVLATDDGKVVKLFKSVPGGLTIYQFDPSERLAYYYAHLEGYAAGVAEGKPLKRGEVIGYVGTTGNANPATPHLHFAIFELGPEKRWWKGTPINPFPLLTGRPAAAP
jgi:murein DD-endopeptidase MepM/ murein hydrolase activator NlpD